MEKNRRSVRSFPWFLATVFIIFHHRVDFIVCLDDLVVQKMNQHAEQSDLEQYRHCPEAQKQSAQGHMLDVFGMSQLVPSSLEVLDENWTVFA